MTHHKDKRSHRSFSDGISSTQPSHRRRVKRSKKVYPSFHFLKKLSTYSRRVSIFREVESFDRLNKECMALFPAAFTSSNSLKQPTPKELSKLSKNTKSIGVHQTRPSAHFGSTAAFSSLNTVLLRNKQLNGQLKELDASMNSIVQSLHRHRQNDEGSKFLQFIANSEHQLLQSSSFNLLSSLLENENNMAVEISPQSEPSDRQDFLEQEFDLLHERQDSDRQSIEEMDEQMILGSTTEQPTWLFQMFVEGQQSVPVDEIDTFCN
jgi:hypothetical protein